jgi:hypothetical protein
MEDAAFAYQGNYIPQAYKQYIKTLERIGKYGDGENNIDILVIYPPERDIPGTCPTG